MRVISDTLRQIELAARLDGAAAYLLPLCRGLRKVFIDAHNAHVSNSGVGPSHVKKLAECEECSRLETLMGKGPLCIDNDAWKLLGDQSDFGQIKPSVDLLMFVEDEGAERVIMVEAKLGGATRQKKDAPKRPTQTELVEKYNWSVERLGGCLELCQTLWLIVSSNTLMKMRRKVWRWNKSDASHPVACLCCAEFLSRLGVVLVDEAGFHACLERMR